MVSAKATGAEVDANLKRRNVPAVAASDASGEIQKVVEVEDKKSRKPVKKQGSFDIEAWIAPIVFTFFGFFTRVYNIGQSDIVTWDEAHFGKFGSYYLKREFYFDVHPPLGKMLVGLSGYLAGYNGSFEFKSGEHYPPELNYTFMRIFNATFGALCVPLAYYTSKQLHFSKATTWLVTLMVLCENSYATISRFILLDSMLLFFTFTTMLCYATFHNLQKQSFSPEWWAWLFLSGLSIGCVCSVKWVGLFVTALVGLYTVEDLWNKFADYRMPKTTYVMHWIARIIGLIIIPSAVYIASFYAHFTILNRSGPGDAQMSSLFQANLRGTDLVNSPLEVAIGSKVTIKNMGYGGGLLHSHVQTYPEGSGQQQITCYHHKDANNDWFFYPTRNDPPYNSDEEPRFFGDKDTIRLIHAQTGRNLHSHTVAAPITKKHNEVSGYGNITVGDDKDNWVIEVVNDAISKDYSRIRTLTTAFRLKHKVLGCYLRAGNVNLPQWGFKQIEVTCIKENKPRDVFTHWNIESHTNEKLPKADRKAFRSPFFRDFLHLNVAMMTSNNALVPDPDKQDDLASQWWQWPILHVGLRMCSWDDNVVKYFLLGNPIVYWGSTASLVLFALTILVYLVRWQRGYPDLTQKDIDHIHYSGLYPLIGWFAHYIPFVAMARVTYVHHYYPALYFAILTAGFLTDHATKRLPKLAYYAVYAVLYAAVIGVFILFIPISFGMKGPNSQWKHLKWSKNWRISN
ncbi:dolichyl-phosphate-mannose-protein mannosyltransferase 2 [Kalaharituber pfeilii]|nr:dolichyl-phosphate-mannose-protein mannosyltransferase 2 [Kalaharituber pfeilii]